jgi:hypothetical protein
MSLQTGFVNAPLSGVTTVIRVRLRMLRRVRYSSASKANSKGATGHLIGISATSTTKLPPSKAASASTSRRALSGV